MAKYSEKLEARNLRTQGKSIKSIAGTLKVSVSSVSLWVRDIILTPEQYETLELQGKDPFYGKRLAYINRIKSETNKKTEQLKKSGIKEVSILSKRELFLVGIALYWSEGFKKDNQVGFANSDPYMINFFLKWLFICFGYTNEDVSVRVTLNQSHQYRIKVVETYWSEKTSIPFERFKKPFFQKVLWQKVYPNPHEYYGVLRVRVLKSKDFLRKIHGYIEGLRLQANIVK